MPLRRRPAAPQRDGAPPPTGPGSPDSPAPIAVPTSSRRGSFQTGRGRSTAPTPSSLAFSLHGQRLRGLGLASPGDAVARDHLCAREPGENAAGAARRHCRARRAGCRRGARLRAQAARGRKPDRPTRGATRSSPTRGTIRPPTSRIAAALYRDGRYGTPEMRSPSDWSPGAPLFYAGVYFLHGGVDPEAARIAVAILGAGLISCSCTSSVAASPGHSPA